ncbi:MAG TPA: carboxypeptidase regulatory-like domain-containing protein [Thermoanaerobaculia bacterium]|nr:carboxypeptidase regulatory-like domain-containing protein [Thermoanaerobaculia bacterium]
MLLLLALFLPVGEAVGATDRRQDTSTAAGPGMIVISGTAVGSDGTTPADFAEITADCKRVICSAAEDGSYRCRTRPPETGAYCIEHPRLGRKRVVIHSSGGAAEAGVVQLLTGSTIRVVKPLHVELPAETKVTLLLEREEIGKPQPIGGATEIVEFEGLEAGKYNVLLSGPEPLQRKLFPIEIADFGESEVVLALEPYRLTGEVVLRKKPLPDATVELEEDAWHADLRTDQSGAFSAELWSPGEYGVSVTAASLDYPYLVMQRASPADSHWRLDVPWRRISGRVFDADSGKPVARARLQLEAETGETRVQRSLDVREDGTFVYPGAGEGRYVITVTADGYLQGDRVELMLQKSDGDKTVELPMHRGIDVRMTVVNAALQPLAKASVLSDFTSAGALTGMSRTNEEGVATVAVAEKSTKTVYVIPAQSSFAIARVSARDKESGVTVTVPDGVATLRLQALTTDREPLPGMSVAIRYGGQEIPRHALATLADLREITLLTDATGQLVIPKLPAGPYEIGWRQRGVRVAADWTSVMLGPGETRVTQTFAVEKKK